MGSSQRRIAYFAYLGLVSLLMLPVPRTEGGLFSCFSKREHCLNCASADDQCDSCRCHESKCEKRSPFRKRKWCGEDAPIAPVGQSLGAVNINQIAIPVAPTQLAVPVSHTQVIATPASVAPPAAITSQNSADLAELRDMLIRANEALQKSKQATAQQAEPEPAASSADEAKVEELKAELEELKQQIHLLSKALVQMKK